MSHKHNRNDNPLAGQAQDAGAAAAPAAPAPAPTAVATPPAGAKPAKRGTARHTAAYPAEQASPHVHRDEFDGQGGMFALFDGKRVRCDDDGNPLPAKA